MRIRYLHATLALALGLNLGALATAQSSDDEIMPPRLEISTRDWDFGTVWQGQATENEINLKNTGGQPMTISVKSSCGCTVPSKPKSPLDPGEETSFKISYNTLKRKGPANQTVTITTNDPENKIVRVSVHGEVKELVKIEPQDGIFFGQLYENSKESKSITLKPQYDEPMTLRLKEGESYGPYTVELQEVKPGEEYKLVASTNPPLEIGSTKTRQEIKIDTGLPRMNEIKVQVHSVVVAPVQVRPISLYVPQNLSTKLTRKIRVTYVPDQPIKIKEVSTDLDSIKAEVGPPRAMPAGSRVGYHEVIVTIDSTDGLPEKGALVTIMTDSDDPRYQKFTVPVKIVNRGNSRRPNVPNIRGVKPEPISENDPAHKRTKD